MTNTGRYTHTEADASTSLRNPQEVSHMATIPQADDQPTMTIWPETGRALKLSRSASYDAAKSGDIPTDTDGDSRRHIAAGHVSLSQDRGATSGSSQCA